eukprot:4493827-Pleurochrysis_carterae.AAC.1
MGHDLEGRERWGTWNMWAIVGRVWGTRADGAKGKVRDKTVRDERRVRLRIGARGSKSRKRRTTVGEGEWRGPAWPRRRLRAVVDSRGAEECAWGRMRERA